MDLLSPNINKKLLHLAEDESAYLELVLNRLGWTIEELSIAMGDSPLRLYRVLEGIEALGLTAKLAIIALENNLDPIE